MAHAFRGLETLGIEIAGTLPRERARELADAPFDLDGGERVRASILAIRIEGLAVSGVPLLRFTYPEVLWLLHLRSPQGPWRLAVRAQTAWHMFPALAWVDRYDTTLGEIEVERSAVRVRASQGGLSLRIDATEPTRAPVIERLWTRARGGVVYEIPWAPTEPREMRRGEVAIEDRSLSDSIFGREFLPEDHATLYFDRPHGCSPAARMRA